MGERPPSPARAGGRALVSVVTIFLNAKDYLEEAIASVVRQRHTEWELLLVDDGSDDGGGDLALDYVRRHPGRIRYLHHPGHANLGMSASRRLGISQAIGSYIAFLDADDVWVPDKLERQVAALERHREAAMVYGPALNWYSWTTEDADFDRDYVQTLRVPGPVLAGPGELLSMWLRYPSATPGTSGSLVRTEAIRSFGQPEDEFRGMYEDQVLFTKLALKVPVLVSNECLYLYRRHPGSCCSVAFSAGAHTEARRAFLTWVRDFLRSERVTDPDIEATLDQEIREVTPAPPCPSPPTRVVSVLRSWRPARWLRRVRWRSDPGDSRNQARG